MQGWRRSWSGDRRREKVGGSSSALVIPDRLAWVGRQWPNYKGRAILWPKMPCMIYTPLNNSIGVAYLEVLLCKFSYEVDSCWCQFDLQWSLLFLNFVTTSNPYCVLPPHFVDNRTELSPTSWTFCAVRSKIWNIPRTYRLQRHCHVTGWLLFCLTLDGGSYLHATRSLTRPKLLLPCWLVVVRQLGWPLDGVRQTQTASQFSQGRSQWLTDTPTKARKLSFCLRWFKFKCRAPPLDLE